MIKIEIDNETYSFLQANAMPFVETPGDVIKRLLKLSPSLKSDSLPKNTVQYTSIRKQPKVRIPDLIRSSLLKDGQKLYFQDSRGNIYSDYDITLSKDSVVWKKTVYSMSNLAKNLLKKHGYNSDNVRGPLFFRTEDGKTIKELWEVYLNNNK